MNALYRILNITKQAVIQYQNRQEVFDQKVRVLIEAAEELREEHPGCGIKKMYYTLKPDFIGRDRFIELFNELGYKLLKKTNYKRTTHAVSNKYPNEIKGKVVTKPSTIWQSDITYFEVGNRFYYGVFITDVYTKVIVGHQVSDHMRATANLEALKSAFTKYPPPRIHHSDRGSQYNSTEYIKILKDKGCKISMAQSAQDNAYAERINNTIKNEYLIYWKPSTYSGLLKCVNKAVYHYNNKRIHNNLGGKKPMEFNKSWYTNKTFRKHKVIIFDH
jgi:putative transposase